MRMNYVWGTLNGHHAAMKYNRIDKVCNSKLEDILLTNKQKELYDLIRCSSLGFQEKMSYDAPWSMEEYCALPDPSFPHGSHIPINFHYPGQLLCSITLEPLRIRYSCRL